MIHRFARRISARVADRRWKIHKFGGSSLADAECFRRVTGILLDCDEKRLGVVVSAMGGMTDVLLNLAILAERDDDRFKKELDAIGTRYSNTSGSLLDGDSLVAVLDAWGQDASDIMGILTEIARVKSAPQRSRDIVAGYGEIWSARLLAACLEQGSPLRGGTWIDARNVVTVRQTELGPTVLWDVSQAKMDKAMAADFEGIAVITGFIATDEQGLQTTLGRNGSDHSAAIFAALSGASELIIWTDVDGIMSADPRLVPEAQVIERLTYDEAMELAYFGAKVLHPQTLGPAVDNDIPIIIRNSRNPSHPGSRISAEAIAADNIKGITAIGGIALLSLEGAGMIGVPGTADRLFAALKNADVSITLISQASSEHSICIAVPHDVAERARKVVTDAFADELESGQIQSVEVTEAQSIIAVVGDGMAGTPGIAARFFGSLGRAGINIRAIAQGSSERNISAVVDSKEATKALRAVHSGFYLSAKTLSIGLLGPGRVGSSLLRQIDKRAERLRTDFNLDLRVRAIARSKKMLLSDTSIDLGNWQDAFDAGALEYNLEQLVTHINPDHLPHAVIIDCTASEFVAGQYAGWLERGIHVVTPNKKAFSGSIANHARLHTAAHMGNSHCLFETTVGAALPIITTLRDLIHTGDTIRSIEGIFSGTLAYLFNVYDGTRAFSEIVNEARASGFTEPDPRDDLSGMDVARKLTILARELGQDIEIGDFPVQSLVPEPLRDCSIDEYLQRLPEFDADFHARYEKAQADNKKLRYLARLGADASASVGLEAVDARHPFANINLTDNIVQFKTDRYADNPLVIQGPGAGLQVTASGVFGDLLRLAQYLSPGA